MEGQTDGRENWQTKGRTDTTNLVIVSRTFVHACRVNTHICKQRKLEKVFKIQNLLEFENTIDSQVRLCS
jgi:hypothetical protein